MSYSIFMQNTPDQPPIAISGFGNIDDYIQEDGSFNISNEDITGLSVSVEDLNKFLYADTSTNNWLCAPISTESPDYTGQLPSMILCKNTQPNSPCKASYPFRELGSGNIITGSKPSNILMRNDDTNELIVGRPFCTNHNTISGYGMNLITQDANPENVGGWLTTSMVSYGGTSLTGADLVMTVQFRCSASDNISFSKDRVYYIEDTEEYPLNPMMKYLIITYLLNDNMIVQCGTGGGINLACKADFSIEPATLGGGGHIIAVTFSEDPVPANLGMMRMYQFSLAILHE